MMFVLTALAAQVFALDPVLTITTGTGAAASQYGNDVSYAGDMNNDGNGDVILGAPGEAKAYLFLGPVSNLATASASVTYTGVALSEFGFCVSNAWDLNNDNYDDVIIGAPGEGCAYVFYGAATLTGTKLSSAANIKFTGVAAERFGECVAGIGDFTGDGGNDVLISSPSATVNTLVNCGKVGLYEHPASGPVTITAASQNFTGTESNDKFGISISYAGDVNNNDGKSDILIGCPGNNTFVGAAYVAYGAPVYPNYKANTNPMLAGDMDVKIYGNSGLPTPSGFGSAVSNASDISGDGKDDIIVGAPNGYTNQGIVYGMFGGVWTNIINLTTASPGPDVIIRGNATNDLFGTSLSWAGDISGDKKADIIIGAPSADGKGKAYGIYGPITPSTYFINQIRNIEMPGESAGDNFGSSVSAGGKSSSLHYGSILVSATKGGAGKAYLFEMDKSPMLNGYLSYPATGVGATVFTINITYTDTEGQAPAFVNLHIYNDSACINEISDSPKVMVQNGTDIKAGVTFTNTTTLPHGNMYFKVESQAIAGFTGVLWTSVLNGPLVDAIAPGKVVNMAANVSFSGIKEGELRLDFTFPGDDNFTGTAKNATIVYNSSIIDDTNFLNSMVLTTYSGAAMPAGGVLNSYTVAQSAGLTPGMQYYFAVRVIDEMGNAGPVSASFMATTYKIPNLVGPDPITGVAAIDVLGDNGGAANVTWTATTATDFLYYQVFGAQTPITDVTGLNNITNITTKSKNWAVVTKESSGVALQNGKTYYFAVVAYDVDGLFDPLVVCSNSVKVINNKSPAPPHVTGVSVMDTPDDHGGNLSVEWAKVTMSDFFSYNLYIDDNPITTLTSLIAEKKVLDVNNVSVKINSIDGGKALVEGKYYYVAVTAYSINEQENKTVSANNTAGPATPFDNFNTAPPPQASKVGAADTPDDDGGSIDITWKAPLSIIFDHYNVYVSEAPITTVSSLTPKDQVFDKVTTSVSVTGLVDGTGYYFAVTVVSWNNVENTDIDTLTDGNSMGPIEPINNHDTVAPGIVSNFMATNVTINSLKLTWNAMTTVAVPDFGAYLITSFKVASPDIKKTAEVLAITQTALEMTGLEEGSEYTFEIRCRDDAGNIGLAASVNATPGGPNQPPQILELNDPVLSGDLQYDFKVVATDDNTPANMLTVEWDFDSNGVIDYTGPVKTYTYPKAGVYKWTVYITDEDGAKVQQSGNLTVTAKVTDDDDIVDTQTLSYVIIAVVILVIIVGIILVVFFLMRKKKIEKEIEQEKKPTYNYTEMVVKSATENLCPKCGAHLSLDDYTTFCPICGAKVKEDTIDEDLKKVKQAAPADKKADEKKAEAQPGTVPTETPKVDDVPDVTLPPENAPLPDIEGETKAEDEVDKELAELDQLPELEKEDEK